MSEVLPSTIAKVYAKELIYNLDTYKYLDWETTSRYATSSLFMDKGGLMFGVLVAIDDKKGEIIILKAFSGEHMGTSIINGYVKPTYNEDLYHQVLSESDKTIKQFQKEGNFSDAKNLSISTQQTLHSLHTFTCIDGSQKNLNDLVGNRTMPSGTGDCCAPKLLSEAFQRGLKVVSMVEFFYGKDSVHIHKAFYEPCESRCQPLIPNLIGLDILYIDSQIIVVNKPYGLLSVPGIGPEKQDCVVNRVKGLIIDCIDSPSVHRLDMDTSGLLVLGLTKEAQRDLSIQFMNRKVSKSYIALLDGILMTVNGKITLPFRLDTEHRPYQIYDEKNGKIGTTQFLRIGVEPYKDRHATRVEFTPLTGRTHQLRVHSAHEKGLNMPIIGDRLYGKREADERLMLHAATLNFIHPTTKKEMKFVSPAPF